MYTEICELRATDALSTRDSRSSSQSAVDMRLCESESEGWKSCFAILGREASSQPATLLRGFSAIYASTTYLTCVRARNSRPQSRK